MFIRILHNVITKYQKDNMISKNLQSEHCKGDGSLKTKIAELRKAGKISQEELALAVGVTRQTITSIEREKYTASLPLAYKIAKYFNQSIEDVFDFTDLEEI